MVIFFAIPPPLYFKSPLILIIVKGKNKARFFSGSVMLMEKLTEYTPSPPFLLSTFPYPGRPFISYYNIWLM
ncbi:MAG: hypothetical protein B6D56_03190 [Candidatus Omnitrophica bacterium 4484_70.1]|nr:MAG: hypothetical protein B6D56_03190 [Candidatus Omnitrophica bacterium 4484_70.1]